LLRNWIIEYFNNSKEQLYLTIMDILTDNNLEEIMEEVKNMGMAKLSEDNMIFLMDAVKKFELDKKFTDKGIEQGRQDELLKTVTKQLTKKFGVLPSDKAVSHL
jgi:predicted regulator of amino acid metabolism with ACT domain